MNVVFSIVTGVLVVAIAETVHWSLAVVVWVALLAAWIGPPGWLMIANMLRLK